MSDTATATDTEAAQLALVDEHDRLLGSAEKLSAHLPPGKLHRAFSVFLLDRDGRVLLQQRAASKYHFGGLWSNSCCGHPGPDDDVTAAASRRTDEELGTGPLELTPVGTMLYTATDLGSGLVERELDHLLVGIYEREPQPDPNEVMATRRLSWDELVAEVAAAPELYTPWLPLALPIVARAI
jgi:isopentenyl-diphosphate delta-isomerase